MKDKALVLASGSRYRRILLERLGRPFEVAAPQIDESPLAGEALPEMALRLAETKARAVAGRFPAALIIGSDQVADLGGTCIGKPGGHAAAVRQLQAMRGRTIVFHTAVVLLDAGTGRVDRALVPTAVTFRPLTDAQIESYLRREEPFDCAGSAKCEGLGIVLLEAIRGDDPSALVGLPLIALTSLLARAGVDLL